MEWCNYGIPTPSPTEHMVSHFSEETYNNKNLLQIIPKRLQNLKNHFFVISQSPIISLFCNPSIPNNKFMTHVMFLHIYFLFDHPRVYWNLNCSVNFTFWLRIFIHTHNFIRLSCFFFFIWCTQWLKFIIVQRKKSFYLRT